MPHDTAVVLDNRKDVNEVSPWMYGLSPSGGIEPMYPANLSAGIQADMNRLRAAHLRLVPSLADVTGGKWDGQAVSRMLHDPAQVREHVNAIVGLVDREKFNGIDIDYEELPATDRAQFTQFVHDLAGALHAHGKVLSVAVFPQEAGNSSKPQSSAQDYAAIGKAADQVRIMGYNYHWATSAPGATAPVHWVRSVVSYAKTQMPASKVVLGVPLFGYDWPHGRSDGRPASAQAVSWLQALRLSRQHDVAASYDKAQQAPHFTYSAGGKPHTVWFENAASSRAKFQIVQGDQIAGTYLWMYGYEDPGTWPALRATLPVAGSGASSTSREVP
jgi:spore germination protein